MASSNRFRPNAVKSIIQTILNEELSGKQYDSELTPVWTRAIADKIKQKIKGSSLRVQINFMVLILNSYKFRFKLLKV